MAKITRKYPGKNAAEIFEKVDQIMDHLTHKLGLRYDRDPGSRSGKVSKMGIHGHYQARDGEVAIELHFPMLIPGGLKRQVTEDIEKRLDRLFA